MAQKYLRPAAVKAGVIKEGAKLRFGFYDFQHALATTNRFGMMVARDGIEPPTPAFSELGYAVVLTT
jgi:hypothetical protein